MNELVDQIYRKQIVSPRSYESHQSSLKSRFQQESDSLRKESEHISRLLREIRKDKDHIQGIDEIIRNQDWEAALNFVKEIAPE